jgi:hypothetical protein
MAAFFFFREPAGELCVFVLSKSRKQRQRMATTTHHNTLTQDKANNYNTILQQPKQALPSLRQGEGTPSLKTASQPTQTPPSTTTALRLPGPTYPYSCAKRIGEQMAGSDQTRGRRRLGSVGDEVHSALEIRLEW